MFTRAVQALTGAEPDEQVPVLLSFLALLFLLLSYYLVKPLRDSLFLSTYNAKDLAWFSVPIIVCSLAVAKFFNHWVGRIPRLRLIIITFAVMMMCKLGFLVLLPVVGNWGIVVFYLWASVYFTLVLSILWGVINTIFSARQAERCFGFVAVGSTLGTILGGSLSSWLSSSPLKDWALLFSILSMLAALGMILIAVSKAQAKSPETAEKQSGQAAAHVSRGMQDILALGKNAYVRGIATMVFTLALISMAIQFQAYSQLDRSTARQVYQQEFAWFDPGTQHFEAVFKLKKLDKAALKTSLDQLAQDTGQADSARLGKTYASYRSHLESRMRKVFSDITTGQGVLGMLLLMVVARFLFRYAGLAWSVLILPVYYLVAGSALMFELEIVVIQVLLVVANALNYSLNNATKELLYTPTSEAVRFQFKPLIEGPVMRLGDVTASMVQIAISTALIGVLALSDMDQGRLLLGIGLLFVLGWMLAIRWTGRRYDEAQKADPPLQELDLNA